LLVKSISIDFLTFSQRLKICFMRVLIQSINPFPNKKF